MIEEIKSRLPLYEATVTDNLHYQMVEDISSLIILFSAKNEAIANRIKELIETKEKVKNNPMASKAEYKAICKNIDLLINELKNLIK